AGFARDNLRVHRASVLARRRPWLGMLRAVLSSWLVVAAVVIAVLVATCSVPGLRLYKYIGVRLELGQAVPAAKVIRRSLKIVRSSRGSRFDVHPADGILERRFADIMAQIVRVMLALCRSVHELLLGALWRVNW